jgi:hypothetical protein
MQEKSHCDEALRSQRRSARRHLSSVVREALRWLALFSGGVFERILLDVSQLAPERA